MNYLQATTLSRKSFLTGTILFVTGGTVTWAEQAVQDGGIQEKQGD